MGNQILSLLLSLILSYSGLFSEGPRTEIAAFEPIFKIEEVPLTVQEEMIGVSYHEKAPVDFKDLRLVTVTYKDFDQNLCYGELIVHEQVSADILDIFSVLYEESYPIMGIKRIDYFNGDDDASMAENNTSAFNHRRVSGSTHLSLHAYGLAIDLNPIQNPYVTSTGILPKEGENYLNREDIRRGMIIEGDICYEAFVSRGWQWGGAFNTVKDYQHFQKKNP